MRFILIISALIMGGCASAPKLTCDQMCAQDNMVCVGRTYGQSTSISADIGMALDPVKTRSSSSAVQCARDESKAKEIRYHQLTIDQQQLEAFVRRCNPKASNYKAFKETCEARKAQLAEVNAQIEALK